MKIKQHHIDNGQIGGIINTYNEGNWIFQILTPLTFILVLQAKLESIGIYIPMYQFIITGFGVYCCWSWFNFAYLKKSMLKQSARQGYEDINHPMMRDLKRIEDKIDKLLQEK